MARSNSRMLRSPISLLNVDYKIATKSLANRVKQVPSIISNQQTGFVKGRYIGENIRLLFDVLEHVDEQELSSLLFFSDFEKAFDSLNHDFMIRCLQHFNFGESFIKWVNLFYTNSISCTINNGHLSDFFPIERGVRQGCPLSPYLFIICIELLSYEISNNTLIKGIHYKGYEIKNTLFADDATFITDGTEQSFTTLIDVLDNFSFISGLKLNTSKCSVLRAGRLKQSNIKYCTDKNFSWDSDNAKTLGMVFSNNKNNNIFTLNLLPKIDAFCNCLKQWQHRKLSLIGKITVIKSFAFPKLVYPLTVLPNPPNDILKKINNEIFAFLWDNKPDKIKRQTLAQDYEKGGLKMLDIYKFLNSLKASWIKRLLDEKNKGMWKYFYNKKLEKYGNELIFECNITESDMKRFFPNKGFLQDVLIAWSKIKCNQIPINKGKEIIWNNSNLKIGEETFFDKKWYERGIQLIEHIYDYRKKDFYDFREFINLYELPRTSFLLYTSIVSCIPNEWKVKLKNESMNCQTYDPLIKKLLKTKHANKYLYDIQLQNEDIPIAKSEEKWIKDINCNNLEWKQIYMIPIKSTIDTKLRDFQYKFIKRIIPTNTFLFKCNISSSNLCDFCSSDIETVKHLFWECQFSQQFWLQLKTFLNNLSIDVTFDYKNICFGISSSPMSNTLINFIILSAKYFIFKSKYMKNIPNIILFKSFLNKRREIEKCIAFEKDKIEHHNAKWQKFTTSNL